MALNIWDWSLFLVVGFPIDVSVKDNCTLEGASLINFYNTATWINLRGTRGRNILWSQSLKSEPFDMVVAINVVRRLFAEMTLLRMPLGPHRTMNLMFRILLSKFKIKDTRWYVCKGTNHLTTIFIFNFLFYSFPSNSMTMPTAGSDPQQISASMFKHGCLSNLAFKMKPHPKYCQILQFQKNFHPIVLGRTRMERDRAWERDYMPDRQKIDYYNLIF